MNAPYLRNVSLVMLIASSPWACSGEIGGATPSTGQSSDASSLPPDARSGADADQVIADAAPGPVILSPSNIPATDVQFGSAGLILRTADDEVTIDTDAGTVTRDSDQVSLLEVGVLSYAVRQPEGPSLRVFAATELIVEPGVEVTVTGGSALVFVITGNVQVDGAIVASGGLDGRTTPGPGGSAGGNDNNPDGLGEGGGISPGTSDSGGGGGGYVAAGGRGGQRAGGGGGAGGPSYGTAQLTPLIGGSGGGGGGDTGGNGGGGGGAVQISASGTIRIGAEGSIDCGGAGGGGGTGEDGGGGGGSGGAILLEGAAVEVLGAIAANGGGGGSGSNGDSPGQAGQRGQLSLEPAAGGQGAGEGSSGGSGGAALEPAGLDGVDTTGQEGVSENAGGGGGSGGRIYVRTQNGAPLLQGIVSPAAGTGSFAP